MTNRNNQPAGVRHLVLFLLCLMYFASYVDRVNISIAGPLMRKELGLTPIELGFIFSSFAYPYTVMQIVGGWTADRFGPRLVLAALSLLWAAATILTGISWSVGSLLAFRLLVGVGEGGAFPAATRALTWWLPVRERGFAQGITHAFARFGGAVAPAIVLAVVARYGWRMSFMILGAVTAGWTVVWLAFFTNTPELHPWVGNHELAVIREGGNQPRASAASTCWSQVAARMWLVTIVDFCYGWSLWVFLTWLPSYLMDARGFELSRMVLMTTLPLFAGVVGDALGGVISDAIYRRTRNLRLARRSMLVVGLGGSFAFITPAVITTSAVTAVCLLAAAFFFLELANAVLWTLPLDIAGEHAGTASGMMNVGFGIAGIISPVVFGVLIQRTGRYEVPLFISAGLLLAGAVCSLNIDPTATIRGAGFTDCNVRA